MLRATYDQMAPYYAAEFSDELTIKPLDRALLAAFVELVGPGLLADVGCGPSHVTRLLSEQHPWVTGIDVSPTMITIARQAPKPTFAVASMLNRPAPDTGWAGIVALQSIIHLSVAERLIAYRGFARALRPGGWLLLAFHVESDAFAVRDVNHLTTWFEQDVELDGFFLDPDDVTRQRVRLHHLRQG